jgi:hypothetical protein
MITIATISSFVGSVFFGAFLFVAGYVLVNLISVDKVKSWLGK